YNWQQSDWPDFTYSLEGLEDDLFEFAEKVGRVTGKWQALPDDAQQEAVIDMMVAEAITTSRIEGEFLSRSDVLSSIRKNLGLHSETESIKDRRAVGAAELMIDVRRTWREPLTNEKLFSWHRMLLKGTEGLTLGAWRTHKEPMQVVSGAFGKETVHYEAPPSSLVPQEMQRFIAWFNDSAPEGRNGIREAPIRSAIAHLYFETIHPFEDGNGRIGRAIAEKALSQGMGRPALLSLSDAIESQKRDYYDALEQAQRSNEVTEWIRYFVRTILDAQSRAEEQIDFTLQKAKFFDRFRDRLNERQRKVINRMLDEGTDGFEGGMNARKYIGITKTSKATATRDMQYLMEIGAFRRSGKAGGRSTRYQVNL
ncbi:MAG: Fic family protein, partial [Balneolaceae bacterium]